MTDGRNRDQLDEPVVRPGGSNPPFDSKHFMPIDINLRDRTVLVVGRFEHGGGQSFELLGRLIQTGAMVDVAGLAFGSEIRELALTYSHRLRVLDDRGEYESIVSGERNLRGYFLVFACGASVEENLAIARNAREQGVFCTRSVPARDNDFAVPTWQRRGRIKMSICTDGLSPALEKAMMSRITAALVRDMDRYKLFADFVYDRIDELGRTGSDSSRAAALIERLCGQDEEIYLALSRQNFDEAVARFEATVRELEQENTEQV